MFNRTKVLLAVTLSTMSALVFANVDDAYVRNKIAGQYRVTVSEFNFNSDITLQFSVNALGQISIDTTAADTDDKVVDSMKLTWARSTDGALSGLPIVDLIFSTGSDEEWHDLHVRLSFREVENRKLELLFLDAIETIHEGPNHASDVMRRSAVITKKNKNGIFKIVRSL